MIPQTVSHIVPGANGRRPLRRVLVVDDVPEIGELYRAVFRRLASVNVQATIEVRSERAIERLRSERFDLVITDFRMPDHSGDTVIAVARETQPDVPLILMSGVPEALVPRPGVSAALAKPLDTRSLVSLLERLLGPSPIGPSPPPVPTERAPGQLPPRSAYPPKRR